MKKLTTICIALVATLFMVSCDTERKTSADAEQQRATENSMKEANRQVGMPGIVNFQEKKLMKQIYELRDQENLICYAYYLDLYGGKHFLGQCIGYGIPYSTQFSNPEKIVHRQTHNGGSFGTLPQPEPNGLFMPDGLAATWLLLLDADGTPHPVYVEPSIIVSPFKLHE